MNQSEVNSFLLCLSRMTAAAATADNDHHHDHHHNHHDDDELNWTSRVASIDHIHDHDHDHDGHDVLVAKGTAMAVLFCATTICGAIPFLLNRCFKWTDNNTNARSATVVKCLLYFGGGVLLCTTFMHLLPEVQETVESLQECGTLPELSFSLADLLMCVGFFAMFLIEELIHAYIHSHRKTLEDETTAAFERGHSIRNSYLMRGSTKDQQKDDTAQEKEELSNSNGNTLTKLSVRDLLSNDMESQKYRTAVEPTAPSSPPSNDQYSSQYDKNNSHAHAHVHSHSHAHSHDHHGHSHLPLDNGDDLIASSLRGLLIVLALSLHELFEGLAIGLEGSASTVWFMFAAVSAHKFVLAFCVGVELIVARTRILLSVVYVVTFAIVSPIGIGIGILISKEDTTASSIPSAILQGLACGTLLYVVFFEILSKNRAGLIAYLSLFIGFGVMFGLQQVAAGHEHSHGGCSVETPATTTEGHTHDDDDDQLTDAKARSLEKQLQILRDASASLKDILQNSNK